MDFIINILLDIFLSRGKNWEEKKQEKKVVEKQKV